MLARDRHTVALLALSSALGCCQATPAASTASPTASSTTLNMSIGTRRFAITLADNAAARAFAAQLPLTLDMADLNANEKHAQLPAALPNKESRPGQIRNGDLMLYGSRTLVLFYLSFDSSYAYTRLGRVNDPRGLAEALGAGDVQLRFSQ